MRHLLLLLLLFMPSLFTAQTMYISEGISIRNDYGYELIGRLRDRILIFRDKYDEFEVQAYDQQMHPAWNRELEDLDKKRVKILAVVAGKNDFSIVYKFRHRAQVMLRLHKYDPGANLIDTVTLKDYGERLFDIPNLKYIESEDRSCMLVYNEAESGRLEATCFRVDRMTVLWDQVVQLENTDTDINTRDYALSNDGTLFLIQEKNNRKGRIDEHKFEITTLKAGSETKTTVQMPEILTADILFQYDNLNHHLIGAGVYGDKNRERTTGAFFIRFTPDAPDKTFVHHEPFDDQFVSILRQKDMEDASKGILDAKAGQIVLREDGGVLLMVERTHEIMRGATSTRGFWRDGARMVVDYYFDDIFIVAFEPSGQSQWKTVLHKKQYSQDDDGTFSSYFAFRNADKLRFLFNDEIKYENTCSEYVVSPFGDFDRNSLLNTEGQSLRLRFRDARQISNSECLIPSEFRNKLRIVLLKFQ
jgi:hypothetical protein